MIRIVFFIALCIAFLAGPLDAVHAGYFAIQLKNGNVLKTEKYWQDGQNIFFFTQSGTVGLPSSIINHISTTDGSLSTGTIYYPDSEINNEQQDEVAGSASVNANKDQMMSDLQDRIAVADTNIINLARNKETYINQKEKYIQDKEKAQTRSSRLKSDPYVTSGDLRERTGLEEGKIMDADQKIKELDSQIQNTDNMIESQKRMKIRLENELAKLEST